MQQWNEPQFKGLEIAYAFTRLLAGSNNASAVAWDAAALSRDDAPDLGKLLVSTAQTLERRVDWRSLNSQMPGDDTSSRQLKSAISGLQAIGEGLQSDPRGRKADGCHWLIIGELVLTIASLLEYIETHPNDPRDADAFHPVPPQHWCGAAGRDHLAVE